jgi:hypothetical protein
MTTPPPGPAPHVAELLADVRSWPLFAASVVHARALTVTDEAETFELWLADAGTVRHVEVVRRTTVEPSTVDVRAADGPADPAALRRIVEELAEAAALPGGPAAWAYTFEDVVHTHGKAADVYEFVRRLDLWPERLAHVEDVVYEEDGQGVQTVVTTIAAADATLHRIPSIRLCLGGDRVLYKPSTVPPVARAHVGQWSVVQHADEVTVAGRHTVVLDPAGVRRTLGADAGIEDATRLVRAALGAHSIATLEAAKAFAEGRLRAYDPELSWDRLGAS